MGKVRDLPCMLTNKILIPKKETVDPRTEFPAGMPVFKDRDKGKGQDNQDHCPGQAEAHEKEIRREPTLEYQVSRGDNNLNREPRIDDSREPAAERKSDAGVKQTNATQSTGNGDQPLDTRDSQRGKGEPRVDASGLLSWECNRIYLGTELIGKRAQVEMGDTAEERVIKIDGEIVKRIKVDEGNRIVKEPPNNKRTVNHSGRVHYDGNVLFVSKSESQNDVWIKTVEKDKVYAIYSDAGMIKELRRVDLAENSLRMKKETPQSLSKPILEDELKSTSKRIWKPERIVSNVGTIKILQQRFSIKGTKPEQKVWVKEVKLGKEYAVYLDKEQKHLTRVVTLKELKEPKDKVRVGTFTTQTRPVSIAGQVNIFGHLIYVGIENKGQNIAVRELERDIKCERKFGVFLGEQQLREIAIIKGKVVLRSINKGIAAKY